MWKAALHLHLAGKKWWRIAGKQTRKNAKQLSGAIEWLVTFIMSPWKNSDILENWQVLGKNCMKSIIYSEWRDCEFDETRQVFFQIKIIFAYKLAVASKHASEIMYQSVYFREMHKCSVETDQLSIVNFVPIFFLVFLVGMNINVTPRYKEICFNWNSQKECVFSLSPVQLLVPCWKLISVFWRDKVIKYVCKLGGKCMGLVHFSF